MAEVTKEDLDRIVKDIKEHIDERLLPMQEEIDVEGFSQLHPKKGCSVQPVQRAPSKSKGIILSYFDSK